MHPCLIFVAVAVTGGLLDGVVIPSVFDRVGGGRGYRYGYQTAALYMAPFREWGFPFLDLRLHRVDTRGSAFNAGLGFRRWVDRESAWGANIYYDFRHAFRTNLHQIGFGLEYFGKYFDMRTNGYLPVGARRALLETHTTRYLGGYFAKAKEYQAALWGVDAEIGKWVYCSSCVDLYAAGGPYFYDTTGRCSGLMGGMGRVALWFFQNFMLGLYVSYDNVFHTKVQGEIGISIPFPLCAANRCLFPRVVRNEILITEPVCCWKTNF